MHADKHTGQLSLDVQYYPALSGAPFEFEPSVDWSRASSFEIVRTEHAAPAGESGGGGARRRGESLGDRLGSVTGASSSAVAGLLGLGGGNGEGRRELRSALAPETTILDIEKYLLEPGVKIYARVSHKMLSQMMRAMDSAGLHFFSYDSRYHSRANRDGAARRARAEAEAAEATMS